MTSTLIHTVVYLMIQSYNYYCSAACVCARSYKCVMQDACSRGVHDENLYIAIHTIVINNFK